MVESTTSEDVISGSDFIRSIVELFDSLYVALCNKEISNEELLRQGFNYAIYMLYRADQELWERLNQSFSIDVQGTAIKLAASLVQAEILEPVQYTSDEITYKPHSKFNGVLKNGKCQDSQQA